MRRNNEVALVEMREMILRMNDALSDVRAEILDKLDVVERQQQGGQGVAAMADADAEEDDRNRGGGATTSTVRDNEAYKGFDNHGEAAEGRSSSDAEFKSCESSGKRAGDDDDDIPSDDSEYVEYIESDSASARDSSPGRDQHGNTLSIASQAPSPFLPFPEGQPSSSPYHSFQEESLDDETYGSLPDQGEAHDAATQESQLSITTAATTSDERFLYIPVAEDLRLRDPASFSDLDSSSIVSSTHFSSDGKDYGYEDDDDSSDDDDDDEGSEEDESFSESELFSSRTSSFTRTSRSRLRIRDRSRIVLSTTLRFFRKRGIFRRKIKTPRQQREEDGEAEDEGEESESEEEEEEEEEELPDYTTIVSTGKKPLSPVLEEEDEESAPLLPSSPILGMYHTSPVLDHQLSSGEVKRKWRRLRKKARKYLRRLVRYLSCHAVFGQEDDSLLDVGAWTSESSGCPMTSTDSECKEEEARGSVNVNRQEMKKGSGLRQNSGDEWSNVDIEKIMQCSRDCNTQTPGSLSQGEKEKGAIFDLQKPGDRGAEKDPTPSEPSTKRSSQYTTTSSPAPATSSSNDNDIPTRPATELTYRRNHKPFPTTLRTPKKDGYEKLTVSKRRRSSSPASIPPRSSSLAAR